MLLEIFFFLKNTMVKSENKTLEKFVYAHGKNQILEERSQMVLHT